MATKKHVLKQLLKEFWIPFCGASAWTIYYLWAANEFSTRTVLSAFGPAFFLASWLTGQVFRVRKQAGVENGLSTVQARVQEMLNQLEAKTQELINHVNGGNSFCAFEIHIQQENETYWLAVDRGEYPLYNVSARVIDLDLYDMHRTGPQEKGAESHIDIGDLSPSYAHISRLFDLGESDSRQFNVFITAKNGHFVQNIKYKRVDGQWKWATKVFSEAGELLREDNGYPTDADGNIWPASESDD